MINYSINSYNQTRLTLSIILTFFLSYIMEIACDDNLEMYGEYYYNIQRECSVTICNQVDLTVRKYI